MESVRVELGHRSYEVRIGQGITSELGAFVRQCTGASRAAVIADSTVARLYGQAAIDALAQAQVGASLIEFPAGESRKTLATYMTLMDRLLTLTPPVDRKCAIVALGGGVTGDMAGFVAATCLRGLNWVQCPTTLLAAVDASVGGKTAVDHPSGKNLIGAFHQPRGVLIDVDTFKTLAPEQLSNGMGESVKHGAIRDWSLLDFIENNIQPLLARQGDVMVTLVRRNVQIKACVVAADEFETGERAHLNFGHTIGHAIEMLVGYDRIGHGAAVAMGMVAACDMAVRRGLIDASLAARLTNLLHSLGLPVRYDQIVKSQPPVTAPPASEVWAVMQHDKKAQAGKVRMILPTKPGSVAIFDDVTQDEVRTALAVLD